METRIEVYRLQTRKWNWALREIGKDVTKMGQGYETRAAAIAGAKEFNGVLEVYLPTKEKYTVKHGTYPIVLIRSTGQDVGEVYSPQSSNGSSLSVKIKSANSNNAARG